MIDKLADRHREELADAEAYDKMAEQHTEWSGVFRDMAHDERTHAKMLKHLMDVLGVQEK